MQRRASTPRADLIDLVPRPAYNPAPFSGGRCAHVFRCQSSLPDTCRLNNKITTHRCQTSAVTCLPGISGEPVSGRTTHRLCCLVLAIVAGIAAAMTTVGLRAEPDAADSAERLPVTIAADFGQSWRENSDEAL